MIRDKKKNPVNQLKFQARINMNLYKKKYGGIGVLMKITFRI